MIDFERCYRAVQSRDARFDGWFFTAVKTTGIYCRPSCPAMTPKRAERALLPDRRGRAGGRLPRVQAVPARRDARVARVEPASGVVGRAMRLIADGVVDRGGVAGSATRLGYSERHLNRQLTAEVGAGPIALARAQRAQSARVLIETTDAAVRATSRSRAGFSSIRQFNDTIRQMFAITPSKMREARARPRPRTSRCDRLCGCRAARRSMVTPSSSSSPRAVPGIEEIEGTTYRRTLRLAHGAGVAELTPQPDHVRAVLRLEDLRDLTAAVQRCRRLFDLDADPQAIAEQLGDDRDLGRLVAKAPGLRLPGTVDGFEIAYEPCSGSR